MIFITLKQIKHFDKRDFSLQSLLLFAKFHEENVIKIIILLLQAFANSKCIPINSQIVHMCNNFTT
jgi:hypothetical protein